MRRIAPAVLAALLVLAALGQDKKEGPPPPKVKVGDVAPDFTLKYFDGAKIQEVKLSDYRGKKNVVLAFYIFAFTPG
jgi:cytochrome oxidase Cu insertion factor (SCO1/SenC/PrrC family)